MTDRCQTTWTDTDGMCWVPFDDFRMLREELQRVTNQRDYNRRLADHLKDNSSVLNAAIDSVDDLIARWLDNGTLLLRAGEMTAQEIRSVKAVLIALRCEVLGLRNTEGEVE